VSSLNYRLLQEDLPPGGEIAAAVYVAGRTDRVYQGRVRRLPQADSKQVPPQLTQRGGGPLAVKQSGEEGRETTPVAQVYLVEVEIVDPDASIRPGTLVQVKVYCRWRSAAWWVKRKLAEALDFGLYQ
jgi:putative peptide zinc metalloprotease protein